MTNPIPAGTCNMSFNEDREVRSILGRIAHKRGISQSQLIKDCIVHALKVEHPEEAQRIRLIHKQRAGLLCLLVLTIGIATGTAEFRRVSRVLGGRREDVMEVAA